LNIKSRIEIERDSKTNNLEQTLFGKLSNIISAYEPTEEKQDTSSIQTVSVEDAIKELLKLSEP